MARHFFQVVNMLSIDVALGSVCSALFIAKYLNRPVSLLSLFVLALTVWIIYTTDHLLDAHKIKGMAASSRHRFHQLHFTGLRNGVLFAILFAGACVFFLPNEIILAGCVLALIVGIYLLFHLYFPFVKEIAVAFLYTAGVCIPSIQSFGQMSWTIFTAFFFVALMNLMVFAWFSEHEDRVDGISSLVTILGGALSRYLIIGLFTAVLALAWIHAFDFAFVCLMIMSCLLLLMVFFAQFFKHHDRYRIGDVIFFITLIYVLL